MRPAVSVISPTKNRLKLLCEAMDSLAKQTFRDWEYLIVDDGSSDGTADEVRKRASADPRIVYIPRIEGVGGANLCRNIGIRNSQGELIVLLDSDDLLRPRCLEHRVEIMRLNSSLDFVVFRGGVFVESVGDLGRLFHPQCPGDDLLRFLTHECPWQTSGPIWRRNFLDKIGGFDETLLSMQDLELHVRALSARAKYVCFPDVDHDIRWQADAMKTSIRHYHDPAYIEAIETVQAKLLDTITNNGLLTWSRERALLGLIFEAAEGWIRLKHLGRATRAWSRGCRQQRVQWHLQVAGLLMLIAARLAEEPDGIGARLVNKWKGWARFRQEPNLLRNLRESSAKIDCAV